MIHIAIYADYLQQKGHGIDPRLLAKSLKAKRSVLVCLKEKERRAFGPIQINLRVDFIYIITTAWVVQVEDLIGQIFLSRNELSLRAIGPPTVVRSATITGNATMTAPVKSSSGQAVQLKGMLDTGAGVSVISAEAWQKLGAKLLKFWDVPIRMANDQPIRVLGVTEEIKMDLSGLQLPISLIVVRDFDVLIDLSHNSILIRDPNRTRKLQRKEVIGNYLDRMKLIVEAGTVLKHSKSPIAD